MKLTEVVREKGIVVDNMEESINRKSVIDGNQSRAENKTKHAK